VREHYTLGADFRAGLAAATRTGDHPEPMPPDSRPDDAPASTARGAAGGRSGYADLLAATASWFAAWGIQRVMFQWLVVKVLREPPARVGAAQMAAMLPSLLFPRVGDATADRLDPRRVLLAAQVGSALSIILAVVLTTRLLSLR
jgi:hypothetical protein